jgi:hypothetical protein
MMYQNLNKDLIKLIHEILDWADLKLNGNTLSEYEFDTKIYNLFLDNEIEINDDYILVYNILDFYVDSVNHNFKEVFDGYSFKECKQDIFNIIETISGDVEKKLNLSDELRVKLEKI